jgi:hypothetical protein
MHFYVSGPVVEQLKGQSEIEIIYALIEKHLKDKGHSVELPIRSSGLNELSPANFFKITSEKIKSSDGIIAVVNEKDQSGPVEATLAFHFQKPMCVVEMSRYIPRLIRGLPGIIDGIVIKPGDLDAEIAEMIRRFLRNLQQKAR